MAISKTLSLCLYIDAFNSRTVALENTMSKVAIGVQGGHVKRAKQHGGVIEDPSLQQAHRVFTLMHPFYGHWPSMALRAPWQRRQLIKVKGRYVKSAKQHGDVIDELGLQEAHPRLPVRRTRQSDPSINPLSG